MFLFVHVWIVWCMFVAKCCVVPKQEVVQFSQTRSWQPCNTHGHDPKTILVPCNPSKRLNLGDGSTTVVERRWLPPAMATRRSPRHLGARDNPLCSCADLEPQRLVRPLGAEACVCLKSYLFRVLSRVVRGFCTGSVSWNMCQC